MQFCLSLLGNFRCVLNLWKQYSQYGSQFLEFSTKFRGLTSWIMYRQLLLALINRISSHNAVRRGELKRLTPAPRTTHWPPLHGLPYGLLHGLPYGLPLRTTLKNQPNSFYGVEKYKKLTCSSYTIITDEKQLPFSFPKFLDPVYFIFVPFFTGHLPKRCFHNGRSVSAVEYLSL